MRWSWPWSPKTFHEESSNFGIDCSKAHFLIRVFDRGLPDLQKFFWGGWCSMRTRNVPLFRLCFDHLEHQCLNFTALRSDRFRDAGKYPFSVLVNDSFRSGRLCYSSSRASSINKILAFFTCEGGDRSKKRGTWTNFVKFSCSFHAAQCKVDRHNAIVFLW